MKARYRDMSFWPIFREERESMDEDEEDPFLFAFQEGGEIPDSDYEYRD